jgi:glutamyl-Q tRNA(Asp) synthetase
LLRIEDLDTPRVVPGCADEMLRTLEAFGFECHGEVLYQSTRRDAYRDAIASLRASGRIFECSCSRKALSSGANEEAPGYPGTCRLGPARPGPTALRFRVSAAQVHFDDLFQGAQDHDLTTCGDVVVERRDGIASYQLAVVVDDAFQRITRVVRGADLLSSTPWQLDLQSALSLPHPIYGHLPLVVEPDGTKLAKSRRAIPLDPSQVAGGLTTTLTLLSQRPPPELAHLPVKDVWKWAFAHWAPQALVGRTEVRCPRPATSQQKS